MRKYVSDGSQNCLQCCLAGLLDRDLSQVPSVHEWTKENDYWFVGFYNWCTAQNCIPVSIVDDTMDELYHIAVIREGDQSRPHAVIAFGTKAVWDPNPNKKARISDLLDAEDWEYSLLLIDTIGNTIQGRMRKLND